MFYKDWEKRALQWENPKAEVYQKFGDEWGFVPQDFEDKLRLINDGDSIFEIGCGGGRITKLLLERTKHITIGDVVPEMLKITQSRFPGVKSYLIKDFHWNLPDKSFEAVVSFGTLVHMEPLDIFYYFGEMHRILKAEGIAILQTSNTVGSLGFKQWIQSNGENHQLGKKQHGGFAVMSKLLLTMMISEYPFIVRSINDEGRDLIILIEKRLG